MLWKTLFECEELADSLQHQLCKKIRWTVRERPQLNLLFYKKIPHLLQRLKCAVDAVVATFGCIQNSSIRHSNDNLAGDYSFWIAWSYRKTNER